MVTRYLVDTNVWSELLKPEPDPAVANWMHEYAGQIRMPVTAVMELLYGVQRLPLGERRTLIDRKVRSVLKAAHQDVLGYGRILLLLPAQAHLMTRRQNIDYHQPVGRYCSLTMQRLACLLNTLIA